MIEGVCSSVEKPLSDKRVKQRQKQDNYVSSSFLLYGNVPGYSAWYLQCVFYGPIAESVHFAAVGSSSHRESATSASGASVSKRSLVFQPTPGTYAFH